MNWNSPQQPHFHWELSILERTRVLISYPGENNYWRFCLVKAYANCCACMWNYIMLCCFNYCEWCIKDYLYRMRMRKRCRIGLRTQSHTRAHAQTHTRTAAHTEINNQRGKTKILSQRHRATLAAEFLLI